MHAYVYTSNVHRYKEMKMLTNPLLFHLFLLEHMNKNNPQNTKHHVAAVCINYSKITILTDCTCDHVRIHAGSQFEVVNSKIYKKQNLSKLIAVSTERIALTPFHVQSFGPN